MGGSNSFASDSNCSFTADVAPRERTGRVCISHEQDAGSPTGLMSGVHLVDQVQEEDTATGHPGRHRRHRGLIHERDQSDTLSEEDISETQQEAITAHRLGGRCHRRQRHHQGHHQAASAGTRRESSENLSGRHVHEAHHHRRMAHHRRGIHDGHHEHKEATVETPRTVLRDEIKCSRKRVHDHRKSEFHCHRAHHHRHRDDLSTNDSTSMTDEDAFPELPKGHTRLNGRQLNAIRLPYIYRHHQPGNMRVHSFKLPRSGHMGKRRSVSVPLSASAPLAGWPAFDYQAFVRKNYYRNSGELPNDVRRDAILVHGLESIHGHHRSLLYGRHHGFKHGHHRGFKHGRHHGFKHGHHHGFKHGHHHGFKHGHHHGFKGIHMSCFGQVL